MRLRPFVTAILVGTLAVPAMAEDAPSLIAKNLEARGGAVALAAIKSISFAGRTIFPGGFEVGYKESRAAGRGGAQGRVDYTVQGLDIVQAYDGKVGWKINPLQGRKDSERMATDEVRAVADASLIEGPLLAARSDGSKVAYLGREDFDGTLAYKLKVSQADGDEFVYWLDPDTFLEIKIDETRKIRGSEQTSENELGDYEKVAGVYFPMSVESWSEGHPNQRSRTLIATAIANPMLGPSVFAEPRGAATPAKASAAAPPDASNAKPADTDKPADQPTPASPSKGK